MSTDRELLELAAKAAGYCVMSRHFGGGRYALRRDGDPMWKSWNPLTDDGDNLRLEVALRLNVTYFDDYVVVSKADGPFAREYFFERNSDPCSAKRYATVRVAAEIGKHSAPSDSGREG